MKVMKVSAHTAQKAYGCKGCRKPIAKGTRYVSVFMVRDDGKPGRDCYHQPCAPKEMKERL